ncbi:MAG: acetylglutamate kinase [Gemmatimonadaceae bacterium]
MTRVVKVGGRVQSAAGLPAVIARAWRAHPASLCVVHGGGDEVSALQRSLGAEPSFVGGRRVTAPRDIELLRMALSGSANKRLVSALVACGTPAVGLSGEDAALIAARPAGTPELGRVGAPHRVNVELLRHLLGGGYLPVISPLSASTDAGDVGALNVNGDDAAAAIAVALEADELLLLSDVPGVLSAGSPVPSLDADEAARAIVAGWAGGGMSAKLEAAVAALDGGVGRVRIGDLSALDNPELGTLITPVRSAV